jgi:cell division protease FtsH
MLERTATILKENRREVLALAHALESHKTLTGEDVVAVLEGRPGPLIDGSVYADDEFISKLEEYHRAAHHSHRNHTKLALELPVPPGGQAPQEAATDALPPADTSIWRRPEPPISPAPIGIPTGNGSAPTPDDSRIPPMPESANGPAPPHPDSTQS